MLKTAIRTEQTVTAGQDIPFELVFNTNDSTGYITAGKGTIRKPGYYDLDANIVVTDVAVGDITASFYADGVELTEARSTVTSAATTNTLTIPLHNIIHAIWSMIETPATIAIRLSTDATVEPGSIFTVKKIK